MSSRERFLTVIGNPRVMRALAGTLLGFSLVFYILLTKPGFRGNSCVLLAVLMAIPISVVMAYLKGRRGNLIQTIMDAAEETNDPYDEEIGYHGQVNALAESEPFPAPDGTDATPPEPAPSNDLGPSPLSKWFNSESETTENR